MRKQPPSDITPPRFASTPLANIITQVREYRLITPLFGGGVTPSEFDPVTVVRATEIRGHLRFWWRACRGGQYDGKLEKMKAAEDKIWGKAYKKDDEPVKYGETVQITVEMLNEGRSFAGSSRDIPAYAAFPLQPTQEERKQPHPPQRTVQSNISFKLTISFPLDRKEDITAALWAWETFGGIGARTRRGFGALQCISIEENQQPQVVDLSGVNQAEVIQWIKDRLAKYVVAEKFPDNITHLSSATQFYVGNLGQSPLVVWNQLVKKLAEFRQIPYGRSGRSDWPEAEAIRSITRRRYFKYKARQHPRKFPRAAFGLPIIFHFKDASKGDPEDTSLQGAQEGKDRLASPLILRPLVCKDNRSVGLALLLDGYRIPPGGLVLKEKNGKEHPVDAQLTRSEATSLSQFLPKLGCQTDILQAFMNYLGGNTR